MIARSLNHLIYTYHSSNHPNHNHADPNSSRRGRRSDRSTNLTSAARSKERRQIDDYSTIALPKHDRPKNPKFSGQSKERDRVESKLTIDQDDGNITRIRAARADSEIPGQLQTQDDLPTI